MKEWGWWEAQVGYEPWTALTPASLRSAPPLPILGEGDGG